MKINKCNFFRKNKLQEKHIYTLKVLLIKYHETKKIVFVQSVPEEMT